MVIVYLVLTILFEVTGTTALKLSQGFSHLAPSLVVVVFAATAVVPGSCRLTVLPFPTLNCENELKALVPETVDVVTLVTLPDV